VGVRLRRPQPTNAPGLRATGTALPLRAAEDEVDPVEHEFDIRCPESPDALAEQVAVDGDESRGRRVRFAPRRTMPGAEAQRRLLVNGTTTTVASRLVLGVAS
jgi:hypothetical protein